MKKLNKRKIAAEKALVIGAALEEKIKESLLRRGDFNRIYENQMPR